MATIKRLPTSSGNNRVMKSIKDHINKIEQLQYICPSEHLRGICSSKDKPQYCQHLLLRISGPGQSMNADVHFTTELLRDEDVTQIKEYLQTWLMVNIQNEQKLVELYASRMRCDILEKMIPLIAR